MNMSTSVGSIFSQKNKRNPAAVERSFSMTNLFSSLHTVGSDKDEPMDARMAHSTSSWISRFSTSFSAVEPFSSWELAGLIKGCWDFMGFWTEFADRKFLLCSQASFQDDFRWFQGPYGTSPDFFWGLILGWFYYYWHTCNHTMFWFMMLDLVLILADVCQCQCYPRKNEPPTKSHPKKKYSQWKRTIFGHPENKIEEQFTHLLVSTLLSFCIQFRGIATKKW